MDATLVVSGPDGPVEPGTRSSGSISIVNGSNAVRSYQVLVVGGERWAVAEPREIRLFPEQVGTAQLQLMPPRSPAVEAGTHTLGVKITDDQGESHVEELDVEVSPFLEALADIRPENARAARKAKYALTVTNNGNARQTYDVSASDKDDMLNLSCKPNLIALDPGESKRCEVRAAVRGSASKGERLGFTSKVQGPGLDPVAVNGSLTVRPSIPPWLIRAGVALLALMVIVVGYLATRNSDPKTSAGIGNVLATTTSVESGLTTVLSGETTVAPAAPGDPNATAAPGATAAPSGPSGNPSGDPSGNPTPTAGPSGPSPIATPAPTVAPAATTAPPVTTAAPTTTTLPPLPNPAFSRTAGATTLGMGATPIMSIPVPAGSWTVLANTTVSYNAPTAVISAVEPTCTLVANGQALDSSTIRLEGWLIPNSFPFAYEPSSIATIQLAGQITATQPTNAQVNCLADNILFTPRVEAGATLVAVPARPADQVVVTKPGATALGTASTTVLTGTAPAGGAWVMGAKFDIEAGGGVQGTVTCSFAGEPAMYQHWLKDGDRRKANMAIFAQLPAGGAWSLACQGPGGTTATRVVVWGRRVASTASKLGTCGVVNQVVTTDAVMGGANNCGVNGSVIPYSNLTLPAGNWLSLSTHIFYNNINVMNPVACWNTRDPQAYGRVDLPPNGLKRMLSTMTYFSLPGPLDIQTVCQGNSAATDARQLFVRIS